MITAFKFVALTGVSLIAPDPDADTPDKVPITVDVQLNVDGILEVGKKLRGVPLQMSCINDVGELVITGLGATFTVTTIGAPAQLFAIGVMT
jgi:hypothetical protein